jgi:hypothetical protein
VDYLPGSLDFDPAVLPVDPALAGQVLWLDALIGNVDRSWRNPNMLVWHGRLWLIDHGAALTFHHKWATAASTPGRPYDAAEHALIGCSPDVESADRALAPLVTPALLDAAVAQVPDRWLLGEPGFDSMAALRSAYTDQLAARLDERPAWLPPLVEAAERGTAGRKPVTRRSGRPPWLTGGSS